METPKKSTHNFDRHVIQCEDNSLMDENKEDFHESIIIRFEWKIRLVD
jgi:hypothetical protein